MKLKFLFFFWALVYTVYTEAARIDTLQIKSRSMNKEVEVVVISPDSNTEKYPVVYLLHGYDGNARTWINIKPDLPRIADRDSILFVCPDGNNSWYWDSPEDTLSRYETFVSEELIMHIDKVYPTKKSRTARAIVGLSMGGHGAMWLSFRHKDLFGAAGSTSGGVDIRPFPENWDLKKLLGEQTSNKKRWDEFTVINQLKRIKSGELALIIDCGYDDFFFKVNNDFHQKLLENKIDHDFLVRPGGHTSQYWNNSIGYQILFFKEYFDRNK